MNTGSSKKRNKKSGAKKTSSWIEERVNQLEYFFRKKNRYCVIGNSVSIRRCCGEFGCSTCHVCRCFDGKK
jgi:hypothetical protein